MITDTTFTIEIVHLMCNEKVLPKKIKNTETNNLEILKGLRTTVYDDHCKLRVFASTLLKSQDTIKLGIDIIRDYGKHYTNIIIVYYCFY